MSRGLDNRNPGNIRLSRIRYKGEIRPSGDAEFRRFESIEWGYRAVFVLLHTYRTRHGCRTLRRMIARYAPANENPTADYLRFVSREAGIEADAEVDTLDATTMCEIVGAISHFENGTAAHRDEVWGGWQLFVRDFGGI